MNIKSILDKKRVRTFSLAGTITDISLILSEGDVCINGTKMVHELTEVEVKFDDEFYCRVFVKRLVETLFNNDFDNEFISINDIHVKTCEFVNDPKWDFLLADKDGSDDDLNIRSNRHEVMVEGIDTKVAIKVDSAGNKKIKKGGKQILAQEMYKKYVLDAEIPLTNKQFVDLLMKDLDMSRAGANTYGYNMRKAAEKTQII